MRVAFIATSLDPGGAETALTALVVGLVEVGTQALVIALRGSGRLVDRLRAAGVPVTTMQAAGVSGVALYLPRVMLELRQFRPEIVQGWMYHGNLVATAAAPISGGRLHWGIRQALGALERERAATNRLIRFGATVSGRPERIVYNSQRARADHEEVGYARRGGLVIGNGFDTGVLRPDAQARTRLRARLNLSEDDFLIGHVARYHPVKDHETFLLAAAQLVGRANRVQVLMAGRGVDSDNAELRAAIDRLGLAGRVSLQGEVDEVSAVLPGLDVLCLSSRSEAFPNVLGEAMSCGIPCVTTNVGDAARIVGSAGLVVPPGAPARLADALQTMLAMHPAQRQAMGAAARARIAENYSLRSTIDQYLRLYSAAIGEH